MRRTLLLLVIVAQSASAQTDERARLEAMRQRHPDDAVVLYNLALLAASDRDRARTNALLELVSRAPGGLDPGVSRGFGFLHGDSAFEAIVARIRTAHPPIVHGSVAFTIPERDLRPEGIAFDGSSGALFVGSFKGRIVRVDPTGAVTDFARVESRAGARVVVGLRVDSARGHLWAAVDDPRAFGDPAVGGSALHQYDIASGRLLARYAGPDFGALNDVAVTPTGEAFATNTSDGSIWRAMPGAPTMRRFLPPGSVPEANGITVSADGRTLYIAGWHDLFRVDLERQMLTPLVAPAGITTGNFDGIYWYRGGLVGIQNGVHPGRVVRFSLDPSGTAIRSAAILERYHPLHNGVTTGAIAGDLFYYLANTQSRSFGPDGVPIDSAALRPIAILQLPLPPEP